MIGELLSTLCALCWAIGIVLMRKGGETVPPLALNFFKNSVAFVLLLISMAALGVAAFPESGTGGDWVLLLLSGALGLGLGDTLFLAALNRLGAGRTALVECCYGPAVAVCLFAHPGLELTLTPALPAGAALVLVGLVLAARPRLRRAAAPPAVELDRTSVVGGNPETVVTEAAGEALTTPRDDPRTVTIGVTLGLISVLVMALGYVIQKPVLDRHDFWWVTTVRLVGGYLVIVPVLIARPRHRAALAAVLRPSPVWRVLVPAALIGTFLAMVFWIAGLKYTPNLMVATVLNQTSTFWVALLAWPVLGEPLTPRRLLAVALGFGGAVLVGVSS